MSIPIAQFSTPPSPPHPGFPPLVSIRLFSTSVSQLLPCKPVHLYHFSRFHIHVLIYDICVSLSDLLHSVWQSLGPSMSQQMTQFYSFLWLSNIPLYICTTTSFFFKKESFFFFNYLFLAVLGLRFCVRAFSSCGKWGPLFIAVRGTFTVAASLVAGHRLQTRRLSSCGSRA